MRTAVLTATLTTLFSELADGAKGGGNAFILNSGDAGLLRSIDRLSAAEASASVDRQRFSRAEGGHVPIDSLRPILDPPNSIMACKTALAMPYCAIIWSQ